jgi:hypothetical protein
MEIWASYICKPHPDTALIGNTYTELKYVQSSCMKTSVLNKEVGLR